MLEVFSTLNEAEEEMSELEDKAIELTQTQKPKEVWKKIII